MAMIMEYICIMLNYSNYGWDWLSGGCSAVVYKWFFKKSLQVSVTANDIFNTQKNDIGYYLNCAQGWQYSHSDSRKVIVALRYNFNTSKSKYRGQGAGQSEKDRL